MSKIKITSLSIITALLGMLFVCFWGIGTTSVYAEDTNKKYSYIIKRQDGLLTIVGQYQEGGYYPVSNGVGFENIMSAIDEDRYYNNKYQDATIYFDNISVGNYIFEITNGSVTLSGSLSGLCYSTYGLVYANGADVTFKDISLKNDGFSYLVRNDGNGALTFESGTFSAVETTIVSNGDGDLFLKGGTYTSKKCSVVEFLPASNNSSLGISGGTLESSAHSAAAVVLEGGKVAISAGRIVQKNMQTAIIVDGAQLFLADNPVIRGGVDIATNTPISAQFVSDAYTGEVLDLVWTGELQEKQVVVSEVQIASKQLFCLTNQGFTLVDGLLNSLTIAKTYTLNYVDDRGLIIWGESENVYLAEDVVEVKMPNANDMLPNTLKKYNFLGWTDVQGGQTPVYTAQNNTLIFGTQNITLYAVWETIIFSISYEGLDGVEFQGPITYNSDQAIVVENPSKTHFVFNGWSVNGKAPVVNLTLPVGTFGDLTLTATWKLKEYAIIYNNIPSNFAQSLGLPTFYTIESTPYTVDLEKFLVQGYSFYGLYYDSALTSQIIEETIYFDVDSQHLNSQAFLTNNQIGQPINFYVDMTMYYNGQGNGTPNNPYLIDNAEQLKTLATGQKIDVQQKIYVKLIDDIVCTESFGLGNVGFEGFVLDGNNHKIKASVLTQSNGYLALFPSVINSDVKNLILNVENLIYNVENKISFGGLFGYIANSTLENITTDITANIVAQTQNAHTIKFSGCAVDAVNVLFNDITTKGEISAVVESAGGDINIYGAGIVGFSAQKCKFINCETASNISAIVVESSEKAHIYLAGLACLDYGNQIINCLAKGNVALAQQSSNQAILCGVVMPFNIENKLDTVVCLGNINLVGQHDKTIMEAISQSVGIDIKNIFVASDLQTDKNAVIKNLVCGVERLQLDETIELKTWFFDPDGNLGFTTGLYVYYQGGEVFGNMSKYYANAEDAQKDFLWHDVTKYLFYGWLAEDGEYVDWENISSPSITLTAKYDSYDKLIMDEQIRAITVCVIAFFLVLIIMFLFDMPKPVRFIQNGRLIKTQKFARTKPIVLPEEFLGKMCFFDTKGNKPFKNHKMPAHSVNLYVFDDEKQTQLEKHWNDVAKKKAEKAKKLKQQQIKVKKEKTIKPKHGKNKKIVKKPIVTDVVESVQPKFSRKKQAEGEITIIKKEIKVIKGDTIAEKEVETEKIEQKPQEKPPVDYSDLF